MPTHRTGRMYCSFASQVTFVDHDNPNHLVLMERWSSRAAYDKYREWAMAQAGTQQAVQSLVREMTTLYLDETGA